MTYNTIEAVKSVLYAEARKPEGGTFRLAAWRIPEERFQRVADQELTTKQDVLEALGFVFVKDLEK